MLYRWWLALWMACCGSTQLKVGLIYWPYAFVDIQVAPPDAYFVFDKLTAAFRKRASVDPDYDMNAMILKTFGPENPSRLYLRYVDQSGAKFGLAILDPDLIGSGSHYAAINVKYVVISLGYSDQGVSGKTVSSKLNEFVRDAQMVCRTTGKICNIKTRLVTP